MILSGFMARISRLFLSAAHWYAGPATPQGPSEFYDLVGRLVPERFREEAATVDPAAAARAARATAARGTNGPSPVIPTVSRGRGGRRVPSADQGSLLGPSTGTEPAPTMRSVPVALSATSLVTYGRCPRQFQWTVVRPLPRRSSESARIGTALHAWIEGLGSGQLPLLPMVDEADEADDTDDTDGALAERARPPLAGVAGLKAAFRSSPYGALLPIRTEAPFSIVLGGHVIRGRVDAVYRAHTDGMTDVVDFKTGRAPDVGDGSAGVQLDLYGLVAVRAWAVDPERLRTTYCYLGRDGGFTIESTDWTVARVAEVEARLTAAIGAIDAHRFDARPGTWCRGCDFLGVCDSGQRTVAGG